MFVRTDNDPTVQLGRIPGLTWAAVKVNGSDVQSQPEIKAWLQAAHTAHPSIALGVWVYNFGPPAADIASWQLFYQPPFVIYDVETAYKADEGGHYEYAAQLVALHPKTVTAAVTSYGKIPGGDTYPSSIDFRSFAVAGWPILAQCYDTASPGDEQSYTLAQGGPYPPAGVHRMIRSLTLSAGEAVYRPEGIDG